MTGVHFILLGVAIFGFFLLAIILYKRRLVKTILTTGLTAKARVYHIHKPVKSAREIVYYQFITQAGTQSSGILTTGIGRHKVGDVLEIYYLPNKPKRNTMPGAWQSKGILFFGITIAVIVLFAVYKLAKMIEEGSV